MTPEEALVEVREQVIWATGDDRLQVATARVLSELAGRLAPGGDLHDALAQKVELPIIANSKSEAKRLRAQGANVLSRCPTCWSLCRVTEGETPDALRYEHWEPKVLARGDAEHMHENCWYVWTDGPHRGSVPVRLVEA